MEKLPLTKRWGRIAAAVFALASAAALLYYSVRGIDWKRVASLLLHARPGGVVGCYLLASLAVFLRSYRWRVLLTAGQPIPVSTVFWATAAGYFGNNFLPARAGELVRTYMIASRSGLKKAFVLTTALSERLADALTLVAIAGLALMVLPQKPPWLGRASWIFAVCGMAGVLIAILLPVLEPFAIRMLHKIPLPLHLKPRAQYLVEQVALGLRALHNPGRLATFAALTAAIWCVDAGAAWAVGRALRMEISLPIAFLLIAALGLGSALPSAPGYVGIYQFVAVSVLTPAGFTRASAIAFILLAQALAYLVTGFWGAIGFVRYQRIRLSREGPPRTPHPD